MGPVVAIVCEYNPLHRGHARQLDLVRRDFGQDAAIVCVMSGNFVQRGEPAVYEKSVRARAAVACGASLVLELPLTAALSSAEGFADGAVAVADGLGCVDALCFGSEYGETDALVETAKRLLDPNLNGLLRRALDRGLSYAAARTAALEELGGRAELLRRPNDILAIEYCKAMVKRGSPMTPHAVHRPGGYHDTAPHPDHPSATALRGLLAAGEDITPYVPEAAAALFRAAVLHDMAHGERAVLARLRGMEYDEFRTVPYGSEGLWSKLARACKTESTVAGILNGVKSKRYAYSRIQRMVLCAYLGLTAEELQRPAPYARVLAFDDRGRQILSMARKTGTLPLCNAGSTPPDRDYYKMECRAADLYSLFAALEIAPVGSEDRGRIWYEKRL